ncbi:hypothetical protein POJ06DRAFT_282170 [Lipomyces tetrasporus]|uniref:HNH nuclease domain-containing protein n=1 Tax=Lipomyces tetrasporus TaxID=54092 RepID=A0AAD7QPB4_9ASCO|nr:uncharacterized protein POJ06DRAFT_282170 [Lipomyces tetrasporus]KAJ8099004.1 hypothetical protein POJ06DRAFT_282170 [Lipomyces tetrasporus]
MAGRRAIGRDVHFYNFAEPDKALGGLILNPSTKINFLSMFGILIVASSPTGHDLTPTDEPLQPGHYDIRPYSCKDTISITGELWIMPIISQSSTGIENTFRTEVRKRDGNFHAAHIFPLSSDYYWLQSGFSRWITNRIGERDSGINSCQNGLLMRSHMHEQFDGFYFSINPDDGYKITCFDEVFDRIDGRILDPVCRDPSDNRGIRDELLRLGQGSPVQFRYAILG